jgi:hypothetical protein
MKILLRSLAFVLMVGNAFAQSNLPNCEGRLPNAWFSCYGTFTTPLGNKYVGEFKGGRFNGRGTFLYLAGDQFKGDTYVGEWKDGKRNGQGTYTYAHGNRYVGEFKDDKFNGQGTYTYYLGNKYVGEWEEGKENGRGTFYAINGSITSQGIWADGKLVSSAPFQQASIVNQTSTTAAVQPNTPISNLPACQGSNVSYWSNCFGTETNAGGTKFIGEFISGRKHGKGQYIWENGDKFVGDYFNNKRNGLGIDYLANGQIKDAGTFKDGRLVSTHFVDPKLYPFNSSLLSAVSQTSIPDTGKAERDRLTAEVEAERKQRQVLEQQLAAAKERERITSELDLERKKRQELEAQLASSVQPTPPQSNTTRRTAHALVIGNGAYPGSGRLDNPVNDANAISQKLRSMGFTVTTVTDANRQRLVQSMAQFRRTAASADISLLYYAGHGVQIFGTNYILPTDVDQTDPAQATIQGVSLNSVVENFLPGKTKLVFLDACRDNALQRTSDRSVSKGLAPISVAEGTLISYATKDGQTAADGVGKNSPFTQALLEHINDPQDIAVVLRKVRERVMKITGGKQQPWEYGSLTGGELILSRIK